MNPLEFGKLIEQFDNKFIIQLNTNNIVTIKQIDNENYVKFYRKGDLMFEFRDTQISENTFIRNISDTRFTFKDNKLISSEIKILQVDQSRYIKIYESITPLNYNNIIKFLENTKIYKNYKAELFILFELFLIFLVFIIFFVIFPEDTAAATLSSINIQKLRKVSPKYIWNDAIFNINNKVFSKSFFEKISSQFLNKIKNHFSEDSHMFILLKIKYSNGKYSSIGKVQRINKTDFSWYIDFILENIKDKSEYYNETQIDSIIFSYGFKTGKVPNKDNLNYNVTFQNYKKNNLQISMDAINYGRIIKTNNLENGILYILQNDKGQTITFNKFDLYNEVEFFKSGINLVKFKDVFINENKFMRIIDNKKFWFENGKQILFTSEIKTKFILKTAKSKNLVNNFITLDIETYIDNNTLIPYLISFYDGKISLSFWIGDYENVENMILDCLKSIFIRKYNGYKVYVHNLAKFDIIFLLKYLVKIVNVQPVIHNDRIISLKINYGKNGEYQIEFKDSYLLLISSLKDLCEGFKVEKVKSLFPHLFVNENNLKYIGEIPDIKYFIKVNKDDYNKYKTNFKDKWNLKLEAVKYCEIDCISLYQVIFKFNNMIFDLFSKNIHNYPTLPSLAFAIFRSNFMKEENIPQLSGKIAKDIREGYTGGAVDVYIPQSKPGVILKGLDVNSLYPSRMKSCLMPVGFPTYFKGDIRAIDPNAFGFFYC
jgi:DNA polymerase type B, organellar and viral